MPRAGTYRYETVIEQLQDTHVDDGGHTDKSSDEHWHQVYRGQASWAASGGREFVSGQKVIADTDWVLKLPANEITRTITADMRARRLSDDRRVNPTQVYVSGEREEEIVIQGQEVR